MQQVLLPDGLLDGVGLAWVQHIIQVSAEYNTSQGISSIETLTWPVKPCPDINNSSQPVVYPVCVLSPEMDGTALASQQVTLSGMQTRDCQSWIAYPALFLKVTGAEDEGGTAKELPLIKLIALPARVEVPFKNCSKDTICPLIVA